MCPLKLTLIKLRSFLAMETLFEANGKDEDEKNGEAGAIDTTDKPNARTHETMESLCSEFEFLECIFIISFNIFQEVQYTVSSRRWLRS